jgi:hypothetical protein
MFMAGNQKGFRDRSLEFVINKTLSSFKDEKKLMIGIKKSFDGKEH